GISWYASGMLRDLADEQGKARVQLAATTAREDLRRMGEDALATARALAERPTLQRLTAEGQSDALPPFLHRACEAGGVYACAVPVFASSGEAIALIEALLPTSAVDAPTRHLVHKLLVTALILGLLAVFAGLILGELVAGPVRALTAAATRLGAGDFSASIPPGGAAEVGALARTSVLANISHEFRTPLAAQLASIELLLAGLERLPAAQQKELVSSLERGTLRLTQLIDNLLESVRIESGQLGIRQQSVALAE